VEELVGMFAEDLDWLEEGATFGGFIVRPISEQRFGVARLASQ
jgi:hypothetical protein